MFSFKFKVIIKVDVIDRQQFPQAYLLPVPWQTEPKQYMYLDQELLQGFHSFQVHMLPNKNFPPD